MTLALEVSILSVKGYCTQSSKSDRQTYSRSKGKTASISDHVDFSATHSSYDSSSGGYLASER